MYDVLSEYFNFFLFFFFVIFSVMSFFTTVHKTSVRDYGTLVLGQHFKWESCHPHALV